MRIQASAVGISLVFKDEEDLQKVIAHLEGMKNYKATKGSDPYPAVYLVSHDRINTGAQRREVDQVWAVEKARALLIERRNK